ncbi:ArnT family glycosyltransferase [Seonamhaeicola marinus]|uniref:Glycosyltransferase family 39 protein n=1 Tax=Seonamhaeicola marinus TaxID=1912246 RepID=A0A5D0HST4_9FLAO|nr:glycosyltransferase family 39 protein [Seonamhaeicola marinus]TYA74423.1 glycosyltransferase family 39 protein [Seonamhaeicola marinus]
MLAILLKKDYLVLYALLFLVYSFGLCIPLMENDSAQHATMAMRMYLENDFFNIYKGDADYLDKPHLHFWLAALSFKLFGISHWAYRIPALMFTFLGAFSAFKLAKTLYNEKAAHIASLAFLSTQAIFLANHDVRTDAVLTGSVICSLWQLVSYSKNLKLKHLVIGALFAGLAFSSKGMLGVFIIGICLLSYLLYERKLMLVFRLKSLIGLLAFAASITPVLYAYYNQFDLHPEKVIEGHTNISGVRFILWDQSFNRLTSQGFKSKNQDHFFFFHTLLWAFIPWSVIFYRALFSRVFEFFKTKFSFNKNRETLTSIGLLLALIIMSFSKSKLPHYLNGLLPVASVLVAGYIAYLIENNKHKELSILLKIQYAVLGLGSVLVIFLSFWAFPSINYILVFGLIILLVGLVLLLKKKMEISKKLIVVSVFFMIVINYCLNLQFYPNLLEFQGGSNAAKVVLEEGINPNDIYKIDGKYSWSLDFYTKRLTPSLDPSEVKTLKKGQWVLVHEKQMETLKKDNINWGKTYELDSYRITRLKLSFLNPKTRASKLSKVYLMQIE